MYAMVVDGKIVIALPESVPKVDIWEGFRWADLSMTNTMNDRSHLATNVSSGMV